MTTPARHRRPFPRPPRGLLILVPIILFGAGSAAAYAVLGEDDHGHAPASVKPAPATAKPTPAKPTGKPAAEARSTEKPAASKAPTRSPAPEPTDDDRHAEAPPTPPEPPTHAPTPSPVTNSLHNTTKAETKAVETRPAETRPAETKSAETEPGDAAAALDALREGNARWVAGTPEHPNTASERRSALATAGQKPFAAVLTCADSRLPVERVFDRGVGDIFVVRVAGNIAGPSESGTLSYAVGHLRTPLVVVMGHTACGAVAAAASGASPGGDLGTLVSAIAPAVDRAKRQNTGAEAPALAALAVRENVWQTMFDLIKRNPEIRAAVKTGRLRLVGAVCDTSTGRVDWMGEHPWQAELVAAFDARDAKGVSTTASADADASH